jgi:hypothetical protein
MMNVPDVFTIVAVGSRTTVVEPDCVSVLEPLEIPVPVERGIQFVLEAVLTMVVVQIPVVRPEHAPVERRVVLQGSLVGGSYLAMLS